MIRWLLASCLVAVGAAGVGCANDSGPAPKRVLLSPVAFDQSLAGLPENGPAVVRAEMVSVLEQSGLEVFVPAPVEFANLWTSATEDLGRVRDARGRIDLDRLDAASRQLVEDYRARSGGVDVLLLAYLEVEPVQIRAWAASWDGVERLVPIDRHGGRRRSGLWPNDRDAPCLSLRVVAYAADGVRLFDARGGLEVLSEYRTASLEEQRRRDLFEDRAAVREGVAIALAPLLED